MPRALTIAVLLLGLATPAAAQDLEGTLKKIKDTNTLTLGYRENSPPFSFMSPIEKGSPTGYPVKLAQRVPPAVRTTRGLPTLQVKWGPVTVADRIQAVTSGRIDLECGSTSITLGRQAQGDFNNMTWGDGAGRARRGRQE